MNNAPAAPAEWKLEIDPAGVAWLCLDKQGTGTNVLSRRIMQELDALLAEVEARQAAGLVVYSGKRGTFVAGADIHEFPAIGSEQEAAALVRQGQEILRRIEALPCPSVAVINGNALGGGLELALATTWRLGLSTSRSPCLGLPEVLLGLHPGFGGTVRSVRLLGVRRAMDLMLTGRRITMAEGVRIGLIDGMAAEGDWRDAARQVLARPRPRRRPPLADTLLGLGIARGAVARSLVQRVRRKADRRHYPAPFAMIDLWKQHGARGQAAYDAEIASFAHMVFTPTSKNLVRVFFLQDRVKHLGAGAQRPARRVHVIGAGIMGGDIAAWCAVQGLEVTLQDREMRFIEPALARAGKFFERRFREDPDALAAAGRRLRPDVSGTGIPAADVIIEAIFENLDAKQKLWREVEAQARPDCLLGTNTSSLPLQDIARCLADPQRLVGLHFFNPVARLPLVEVVRAPGTADAAVVAGLAFTRQIDKLPVPCRSQPGFLVNRILAPYLAEAMTLAEEGTPLAAIDAAATDFGMPVGPVELADSVGLDIVMHVARILAPVVKRPVGSALERLVQEGHLGQKTGRGFYAYQEGRPVKPMTSGAISRDAQDRLIFALLNEAAQCLAEGVVDEPDLIDAGVIFGTGFAPFRGGPLHYARSLGIASVVARLQDLATRFGDRFVPSSGWKKLGAL